MAQASTSDIRGGFKLEIEGQPYVVISNEFVKPGKGQAFNRIRVKHLLTGRTVEKTFKSGEKIDLADVAEKEVRLLYSEVDAAVFMCDETFEQYTIAFSVLGDTRSWLKDDSTYRVIFYNGEPVNVEAPTFMEFKIIETAPGVRGDTASGRVMKPAKIETGAEIQIPIFVEEGEIVKVDTRTGEYASRV